MDELPPPPRNHVDACPICSNDEVLYPLLVNSNGNNFISLVRKSYFYAIWARPTHSNPHLNDSHFIASTRMEIIKWIKIVFFTPMRCSDPEWEARRSGNWKHFELAFSVVHRICANDSHKVLELPVFIAFKIDSTFYFPISIGHLILKCVQRSTDVATPEKKSNSTTPSVVLMLMKINWVWSVCVCVCMRY